MLRNIFLNIKSNKIAIISFQKSKFQHKIILPFNLRHKMSESNEKNKDITSPSSSKNNHSASKIVEKQDSSNDSNDNKQSTSATVSTHETHKPKIDESNLTDYFNPGNLFYLE
jgi:hypothetical protein